MYVTNPHERKKEQSYGKENLISAKKQVDFLSARRKSDVSGFEVGSHSGRQADGLTDGQYTTVNGTRFKTTLGTHPC